MRRVVCAANRMADPKSGKPYIILGARHWDGIMNHVIHAINISLDTKLVEEAQGFVDQRGQFMSRSEALIVATEANQIIKKSGNPESKELFSEDIY